MFNCVKYTGFTYCGRGRLSSYVTIFFKKNIPIVFILNSSLDLQQQNLEWGLRDPASSKAIQGHRGREFSNHFIHVNHILYA